MFLGTQVRETTDYLIKNGVERTNLIEQLGIPFVVHRSFSWLVLLLMIYIAWWNEKRCQNKLIRLAFGLLCAELISGVLLAYAQMPGLVQTAHLVFASLLLVALWFSCLQLLSYHFKERL
jgi:cytochrome c oxidase assembly protein subunit 15